MDLKYQPMLLPWMCKKYLEYARKMKDLKQEIDQIMKAGGIVCRIHRRDAATTGVSI